MLSVLTLKDRIGWWITPEPIPKDYWWIAYPTSTEFSIQSGADCTYFVELRRPVRKRIAANGGGVLLEALLLK